MAHQMLGEVVEYTRPVIIKPGFRRLNEDTNEPEEVASVIEMQEIPATIVGVEPRYNEQGDSISPCLHLAYLHPDRLHHLSGSGWRDAFDRALSVRPASHPDCIDMDEHIAFWRNGEVEQEVRSIRRAKLLADEKAEEAKRAAEAKAAKPAKDPKGGDPKKPAEAPVLDTPPVVSDAGLSGTEQSAGTGVAGDAADPTTEAPKTNGKGKPAPAAAGK